MKHRYSMPQVYIVMYTKYLEARGTLTNVLFSKINNEHDTVHQITTGSSSSVKNNLRSADYCMFLKALMVNQFLAPTFEMYAVLYYVCDIFVEINLRPLFEKKISVQ
jgi:hypothetical protein